MNEQSPVAHRPSRDWRRTASRLLAMVGAGLATTLFAILIAMALADGGLLDRPIEYWASAALHRDVRFDAIRTHLLTRSPRVRITGLRIANPSWLGGGEVARAATLTIDLRFAALLHGALEMTGVAIDRPVLRLVRLGPNRNNWSISSHSGTGRPFAPLATVRAFTVSNGFLQVRDYARHLVVRGPFDIGAGASAFHFSGRGMLRGGAIQVAAAGGPLHGTAVGRPYPFAARIIDGATLLDARGTSVEPFDLSQYRLAIASHGRNLADIGYLFDLVTPNSAPYRLKTIARSDGQRLRFDRLTVATGTSVMDGTIWSDHAASRRDISAVFHATRLDRGDIDAILSAIPPRALARSKSGAVFALAPSRWLLSDAPFGLQRLRATDLHFRINADAITGYPAPLTHARMRIDLDHGLLDVTGFRADLYDGTATGRARVDARGSLPRLAVSGRLTDLHLARIGARGVASLRFDLTGTGNSLHRAAGRAAGSISGELLGGTVPTSAAWIVGGDLVRAAAATIGGGASAAPLTCAAGRFEGQGGRMVARSLGIVTPMGTASGRGTLDLGAERLDIVISGTPARRRLFQVAAPVRVSGPWLHPTMTILPGQEARALGLGGKLGVLLTPLAGLLSPGRAQPGTARGSHPFCR